MIACWQSKNIKSLLLWPLSLVYRFIVFIRKTLYLLGLKKTTSFSVPVIVVGNITVGGTGKSPLVGAIVKHFQAQGKNPGIVSRGYRGEAKIWPQPVENDSDPRLVGDEPVMLARQCDCPVVVAPDRVAAVKLLLEKYQCDVVVSDDGLQHYALGRDVEIAVVDSERRFGNGFCLPAGPLREPKSRLKTVNCIVMNGGSEKSGSNVFNMQCRPNKIYQLNTQSEILVDKLNKTKVHAVAAIGNPKRFFNSLQNLGFNIIPHEFPDHCFYQKKDLEFNDDLLIIMTEKDAVKCLQFNNDKLYYLSITAELDQQFFERL